MIKNIEKIIYFFGDYIIKIKELHYLCIIMRKILYKIPRWVASTVVVLAVAYLTLYPDPFPTYRLPLFEGEDKVIHAIMFFGVAICLFLDWSRNNKNKAKIAATSSLVATAYGALTEILQSTMGYGRTGDLYDLLADIIGIAAAYGIAMWLIRKKKW